MSHVVTASAMLVLRIAALGAVAVAVTASPPAASSPLDVGVFAPWPSFAGSLLGEAAEFLAAEDGSTSNKLFWTFHDAAMALAEGAADLVTDAAAATRVALDLAQPLLAPATYAVLRLSLAARAYSPALEMVRQLGLASPGHAGCGASDDAWAELEGIAACTPAQLRALVASSDAHLSASRSPLLPGDHEFRLGADSRLPLLAVWGSLGGVQAAALHAVAAEAAAAGTVRYVWRTFLSDGGPSSSGGEPDVASAPQDTAAAALPSSVTWLAGYGVIVDVKSTEYKAVDERTSSAAHEAPDAATPGAPTANFTDPTLPAAWLLGLADLHGNRAEDALARLRFVADEAPAASSQLAHALGKASKGAPTSVRDAAGYAPFSEGPLAPWEMGDLSLQAASYVMDAAAVAASDVDPLSRLLTVTANFPSLARALSRLPVPALLRAEARNNTRRLAAPLSAALTVNGISVDPSSPTFNLYSLLNVLRAESGIVAQFDTLPLSLEDRRRVQALAVPGTAAAAATGPQAGENDEDSGNAAAAAATTSDIVRLDVWVDEADFVHAYPANARGHAHPIIHWLNDVSDASSSSPYRGWPSSLSGLLRPSWQLHPIAANLYSAILVADLSSEAALQSVATAGFLVQARVPIRYGVVALPGGSKSEAAALATREPLPSPTHDAPVTGLQIALLHAEAITSVGLDCASGFLSALAAAHQSRAAELQETDKDASDGSAPPRRPSPLTVRDATEAFSSAVAAETGAWSSDRAEQQATEALVDEGAHLRAVVEALAAWASSRGIGQRGQPTLVINGRLPARAGGVDLQADGMPLISEDMQTLQRAVAAGTLDDSVSPSVYAAFLGRATRLSTKQARASGRGASSQQPSLALPGAGTVVPRYNSAIFAPSVSQRFLPFSAPAAAPLLRWTSYVGAAGTGDSVKSVSLTVFDDVGTQAGLSLLASALAFVRPSGAEGRSVCFAPSAADCLVLPERFAQDLRSSVRVGLVNLPATHSSSPRSVDVGRFIAVVWAAVTGAAGNGGSDACSAARALGLQLRSDEQAVVLSAIVDAALAATTRTPLLTTAALASELRTLFDASSPRGASLLQAGLRPKVLVGVAQLVEDVASDAATLTSRKQEALESLVVGLGDASAVARALLPVAVPESQFADHALGTTRLRAVAANGRILALSATPSGVTCVPEANGANAVPSALETAPDASLTRLGPCVGPLELATLAQHERGTRGAAVATLLASPSTRFAATVEPDDVTADWLSGVVMSASSAIGTSLTVGSGNVGGLASGRVSISRSLASLRGEYTRFTSSAPAVPVAADLSQASVGLEVFALLDPVSESAQRLAPLLVLLRDRLGAIVTVQLLPSSGGGPGAPQQDKLPLRSFYRFVMPEDVDATNAIPLRPRASFAGLPGSSLLTMQLAVPEPWNVQAVAAPLDLDNMRLATTGGPGSSEPLRVRFWLRDLLVAGQCFDRTSSHGGSGTPNGLQLQLLRGAAESTDAAVSDTLVMQNLGYWQLKARHPGVYSVALAPGRASDLYVILNTSSDGAGGGYQHQRHPFSSSREDIPDAEAVAGNRLEVAVRDFTGPITQLSVRKRAGMEAVALLDALGASKQEEGRGLWASMSRSLFGGNASGRPAACVNGRSVADGYPCTIDDAERPTYHIFSVASGHLYERFLKIMMLSATKRSPSGRLVFWLVENFLSPQFKESVPALAATLGFDIRFVTYKWPNWLRMQTEKQRLIWGYKILFLDVLFPLDVERVIFVDADQIVRSDLGELWHMDLEGAPYGFTPFCTSREDTLGYQFWRTGFWKEHLGARPYHISALFVVDLVAFRRSAVGDSLRAIYDNLSRDPNSLSNLDQDLPNYAQTMVPIFSLPQEWLWCESWCSGATLATAKTVDLCNNPRYKEPKLTMAQRVVQGSHFKESWVELDAEIARAEAQWASRATASTDAALEPEAESSASRTDL